MKREQAVNRTRKQSRDRCDDFFHSSASRRRSVKKIKGSFVVRERMSLKKVTHAHALCNVRLLLLTFSFFVFESFGWSKCPRKLVHDT